MTANAPPGKPATPGTTNATCHVGKFKNVTIQIVAKGTTAAPKLIVRKLPLELEARLLQNGKPWKGKGVKKTNFRWSAEVTPPEPSPDADANDEDTTGSAPPPPPGDAGDGTTDTADPQELAKLEDGATATTAKLVLDPAATGAVTVHCVLVDAGQDVAVAPDCDIEIVPEAAVAIESPDEKPFPRLLKKDAKLSLSARVTPESLPASGTLQWAISAKHPKDSPLAFGGGKTTATGADIQLTAKAIGTASLTCKLVLPGQELAATPVSFGVPQMRFTALHDAHDPTGVAQGSVTADWLRFSVGETVSAMLVGLPDDMSEAEIAWKVDPEASGTTEDSKPVGEAFTFVPQVTSEEGKNPVSSYTVKASVQEESGLEFTRDEKLHLTLGLQLKASRPTFEGSDIEARLSDQVSARVYGLGLTPATFRIVPAPPGPVDDTGALVTFQPVPLKAGPTQGTYTVQATLPAEVVALEDVITLSGTVTLKARMTFKTAKTSGRFDPAPVPFLEEATSGRPLSAKVEGLPANATVAWSVALADDSPFTGTAQAVGEGAEGSGAQLASSEEFPFTVSPDPDFTLDPNGKVAYVVTATVTQASRSFDLSSRLELTNTALQPKRLWGVPWYSQEEELGGDVDGPGAVACFRTSSAMARDARPESTRVHPVWDEAYLIRIAAEEDKDTGMITALQAPDATNEGARYINSELDKDRPVCIGVSWKRSSGNVDGITDHWVLIVGRDVDEGGQPIFLFHDPGPGPAHASRGNGFLNQANRFVMADMPNGRLLVRDGYIYESEKKNGKHHDLDKFRYEVAVVRKNDNP